MDNENKTVVKQWFEIVWKDRNVEALDEVISTNHVFGLESVARSFKALYRSFPDMKAEMVDQIAEYDKVMTRIKVDGTRNGERYSWQTIFIHRIQNGKIVDAWQLSEAPKHPSLGTKGIPYRIP